MICNRCPIIYVPPCVAGHFLGYFYVKKNGAFIQHIFMVLYEISCGGSRMTAL